MITRIFRFVTLLTFLLVALALPSRTSQAAGPPDGFLETIPLHFEPNQGQASLADANFLSRGNGYSIQTRPSGLIINLDQPDADRATALEVLLVGANPKTSVVGVGKLPGVSNYLIGQDPAHWRTHIPTYSQVRYEQVWPGVDLVLYGNQGQLEYDFVVAPKADPARIKLAFSQVDSLRIDAQGDLIIELGSGELRQKAPLIYQEMAGKRVYVEGGFVLSDGRLSFRIGDYNPDLPLVIDPILIYSSFFGGGMTDYGHAIATGANGDFYIAGSATAGTIATAGAYDTSNGGGGDAFVAKFNLTSGLVYSTFLGGNASSETALDIAVDGSGRVFVTGQTSSNNFPTTAGAYDTSFNGTDTSHSDGFVAKLNATGSALIYSTFLGDITGHTLGNAIAIDGSGQAFVTGNTGSSGFPTTTGAYDTTYNGQEDVFVTKFNSGGSSLLYSTFLGGDQLDNSNGIGVDSNGLAFITGYTASANFPTTPGAYDQSFNGGYDSFVTKLNSGGSGLVYNTFLGGSGDDRGYDLAVDTGGNAFVTGYTDSANFQTTPGAYDVTYNGGKDSFVTKFNPAGSNLSYSTFLGGSGFETAWGITVDSSGQAFISGETASSNFPVTYRAYDTTYNSQEAFIAKINAAGSSLIYNTFLGSAGWDQGCDIAIDPGGNVFIIGVTDSAAFPITPGGYDSTYNGGLGDIFIAYLFLNNPPSLSDIANQTTRKNVAVGPVHFTVADSDTPIGSLTLSATSSNPGLIPANNISFGGSGTDRSLTLVPVTAQMGSATITVTVSDGVLATSDSFTFIVNHPPTISDISDQVTAEDTATGPLALTLSDPETAAGSLSLSATSSNTALVPVNNIVFGGTGANRTMNVTPLPNQFGSTTIMVTVTDGLDAISDPFILTVNPVNDRPLVSEIADQLGDEDTPIGPLDFRVDDVDTPLETLTFTIVSLNPILIPTDQIFIEGQGHDRTVRLIPALNQFGAATIIITVSDGLETTPLQFDLVLRPVNDLPAISAIPDQVTAYRTKVGPLEFTVGDLETETDQLILTAQSSDPAIVDTAGITFEGNGAHRTITLMPKPEGAGSTIITVQVSDLEDQIEETFRLTVNDAGDDTDGDGMPDIWEIQHGLNPMADDAAGDPDHDGLTNLEEYEAGTDPQNADTDGDSLPDGWEVDSGLNPLVHDAAGDPDGDGLSNRTEYETGTDPQNEDTDGDGMADGWEVEQGLDPLAHDAGQDPDGDGAANLAEYQAATDPQSADTDEDGLPDGWEIEYGLNPLANDAAQDPDGDGLTNLEEYKVGTKPGDNDTDNDSLPDGWEVGHHLDPLANDAAQDPDGDGLSNLQEYQAKTDPENEDTDGDGLADGAVECPTGLPCPDTDKDGLINPLDPDDEGDGLETRIECPTGAPCVDTDGDGLPDYLDPDSDNDGISDKEEGTADPDGDGIPNYRDADADGDGILDKDEGTGDPDGDGLPNYLDRDSDGDGVSDEAECPGGAPCADADGDGSPDYLDTNTDSDGDGIPDAIEDADRDGNPANDNADGDGLSNHRDLDSDGDGLSDRAECPLGLICPDTDGDGAYDFLDPDSDGDGTPDAQEGSGDLDGDGLPNYLDPDDGDGGDGDSDGDGIEDGDECPNGLPCPDSDGDGIPDYQDPTFDLTPGLFVSIQENQHDLVAEGVLPVLSITGQQISSATHTVKKEDWLGYAIKLNNTRSVTTTVELTVTFESGFGAAGLAQEPLRAVLGPYGSTNAAHQVHYSQQIIVKGPATATIGFELRTGYGLNWTIERQVAIESEAQPPEKSRVYLPLLIK